MATREELDRHVHALFGRRNGPVSDLAADAGTVAQICHAMATRFHQGGKLIVFGNGTAATDAQHIAVEFVHPVIVGKPALPAVSLTADVATMTGLAMREGFDEIFAYQLRALAEPNDIAMGISTDGDCRNVHAALSAAGERGLLAIALVGGDGGALAVHPTVSYVLHARSNDPRVVKEVQVTTYHLLWELVHVFLENPGVLPTPVAAVAG